MKKLNDDAVLLTNDEFAIISKYEAIKKEQLEQKSILKLNNEKVNDNKVEKKDNWLITILGLMTALMVIIGIGCVALLGNIYELLEMIGGLC